MMKMKTKIGIGFAIAGLVLWTALFFHGARAAVTKQMEVRSGDHICHCTCVCDK